MRKAKEESNPRSYGFEKQSGNIPHGLRVHSRVDEIVIFPESESWETKSGGKLVVPFVFNFEEMKKFFSYEERERSTGKEDIRGLRMYRVSELKNGVIGAMEFHKIRNEIITVIKGSAQIDAEDIYGGKKSKILLSGNSMMIPNYIMHTYKILEDDSELIVIANTTYNAKDKSTHDSFSVEEFEALKQ